MGWFLAFYLLTSHDDGTPPTKVELCQAQATEGCPCIQETDGRKGRVRVMYGGPPNYFGVLSCVGDK